MKSFTVLEILQCILFIQRGIIVIHGAYAGRTRLTRRPQSKSLSPQSTYSEYHHDAAINAEEEAEIEEDHEKILKYGPQVGAHYKLTTKIPVIGVQTFQLRILT